MAGGAQTDDVTAGNHLWHTAVEVACLCPLPVPLPPKSTQRLLLCLATNVLLCSFNARLCSLPAAWVAPPSSYVALSVQRHICLLGDCARACGTCLCVCLCTADLSATDVL